MKRVIVYCEGPTEETFIKRLLAPVFYDKEIYLVPSSCDGVSKYSIIKRDMRNLCRRDTNAIITTMLDYYGLPVETPGMDLECGMDIYRRVTIIEDKIKEDIGADNLIPNLMVHEFEALLFTKPECFSCCGLSSREINVLLQARAQAESPEHINNNPNTAPSKRILSVYPAYQKPLDGYSVASQIGIEAMRQECRHFNEWIDTLMRLS